MATVLVDETWTRRVFMMGTMRLIVIAALLALPLLSCAQTADTIPGNKVVTNAQMVGFGGLNILDTYLSPEKYSGLELRYISHTVRSRGGSKWSRMLLHQGSVAYADNRAGNGNEIAGMYTFDYGIHYNWRLVGGKLDVRAGGQVGVEAGFVYNTRNGNNPAQARLAMSVQPSAAVAYRFRLGKVPSAASYEASVPVIGVMFSPNYGQSYYEIFSRGDYDHNAVLTTLANAPSLRQTLALDFTFGHTTLRLGYLGDFRQAKVNGLKYHTYSNMLIIGFVRHFKLVKIVP